MIPVPGGRPQPVVGPREGHGAQMRRALRDCNFVLYLAGLGGLTSGTLLYLTFLPLFLKERLGIAPGVVVTMDTAVMVGGALSALLWVPPPTVSAAVGGHVVGGAGAGSAPRLAAAPAPCARTSWGGACCFYFRPGHRLQRFLHRLRPVAAQRVVPPAENTAYTALYYAWLGLVGGAAPLLAGALLQVCGPWERHLAGLTVDGHALLFALAELLLIAGWACYGRVRPDDRYRTRDVLRRVRQRVMGWLGRGL